MKLEKQKYTIKVTVNCPQTRFFFTNGTPLNLTTI